MLWMPLARLLPLSPLLGAFTCQSSTPTPSAIATTLIPSVATLINIALLSASPDRVMSTRPVPEAHRTRDAIAPKYLLITGLYHFFLEAMGAANMTVVITIKARRSRTGMVEPSGTYESALPPKMLISSSKEALTSGGADWTAVTSSSSWVSVRVSSSKAWNTSVASSAVAVARASGFVAISAAWLADTACCVTGMVVVVGGIVVVVGGSVEVVDVVCIGTEAVVVGVGDVELVVDGDVVVVVVGSVVLVVVEEVVVEDEVVDASSVVVVVDVVVVVVEDVVVVGSSVVVVGGSVVVGNGSSVVVGNGSRVVVDAGSPLKASSYCSFQP